MLPDAIVLLQTTYLSDLKVLTAHVDNLGLPFSCHHSISKHNHFFCLSLPSHASATALAGRLLPSLLL